MSVTQKQLLEGALKGEGVHQRLTVGGYPAEDGVTFESAHRELYKLIDDGLVELGNDYRPRLTDKGIETLASL
jgi:hypothetical protein